MGAHRYLLDTNIVSYFMKQHSLAAKYQLLVQGAALAISFMTVAELYEGADRANWGPAKLAIHRNNATMSRRGINHHRRITCGSLKTFHPTTTAIPHRANKVAASKAQAHPRAPATSKASSAQGTPKVRPKAM